MSSISEIKRIFDLQSEPTNIVRLRNSSYKERIEKIKRLQNFVLSEANHQIILKHYIKIYENPMRKLLLQK